MRTWWDLQRNHNHTTICKIEKVIDETPTVRTLVFSDEIMSNVLPGQFAMVWIPGINELPMSVMISQEQEKQPLQLENMDLHQLDCLILRKDNNLELEVLTVTLLI